MSWFWYWIVNNDNLIAYLVIILLGVALLSAMFDNSVCVYSFTTAMLLVVALAHAYDYTDKNSKNIK